MGLQIQDLSAPSSFFRGSFDSVSRQFPSETTKSPLKLSPSPISDREGGCGAGNFRKTVFSSSPKEKEREGNFFSVSLFPRVYSALSRSPLSPSGTPPSQLPSCSLSLSPLSDATFFVWEVLFGQGKDWPPDTGLLAALYFLHTCAVESVDCGRYEDFFEALPRCIWGAEEERGAKAAAAVGGLGEGGQRRRCL